MSPAASFLRVTTFLLLALSFVATTAAADKPAVSGTFKGNGKPAKLAYVTALKGEPFSDKETIVLVFTEKDHSKDKKPDFKAAFGDYGSALIITTYHDGQIIGCEVAHQAHKKSPFSSVGSIETKDFAIDKGKISGKITTSGELDAFDQKWEVDLKFEVKGP